MNANEANPVVFRFELDDATTNYVVALGSGCVGSCLSLA
jgi:hypothetical protein